VEPMEYYIYIGELKIPFITTVIIGSTDIEVEASDAESGMDRVEFYVGNTLKSTDSSSPYTWRWSDIEFGRKTIKVIAYDIRGNSATDQISVWKFF
jgi:hypothetical protein